MYLFTSKRTKKLVLQPRHCANCNTLVPLYQFVEKILRTSRDYAHPRLTQFCIVFLTQSLEFLFEFHQRSLLIQSFATCTPSLKGSRSVVSYPICAMDMYNCFLLSRHSFCSWNTIRMSSLRLAQCVCLAETLSADRFLGTPLARTCMFRNPFRPQSVWPPAIRCCMSFVPWCAQMQFERSSVGTRAN